jgi:hypothetical protein
LLNNHKKNFVTKNFFQKLAIFGLSFIIGLSFAAPERLRRDAPILPAWEIPYIVGGGGFEGRSEIFEVPFALGSLHDEYGIPHEEYGPPEIPHEEYGPPPVPHEEYGPPEVPTTEQ